MTSNSVAAKTTLPFMEKPLIGTILAFAAGLMNAFTLIFAGTFATVQSGNVVSVGLQLANADMAKWVPAAVSVLAFGLGSLVMGLFMAIQTRNQKVYSVIALSALAVLVLVFGVIVLAVPGLNYVLIAYGVSFVAGAMGNAFHKTNGMLFGAVAVTFVVQMAFNFLIQAAFKREGNGGVSNLKWSGIFFAVLAGFAGGGLVGALIIIGLGTDPTGFMGDGARHLDPTGGWVLILVALIFVLLAALSYYSRKTGTDPDPVYGDLVG